MIEWSGTHEDPLTEEQVRRVELEARREVALLAFAGHQQPRAVIDDWNEVAYTCDYCGLWGHTYAPDKMNRYERRLDSEREGAVFTEKCVDQAVHKVFGYFDPGIALERVPGLEPASPSDIEERSKKYKLGQEEREKKRLRETLYRLRVKMDPERYKAYRERRREEKRRYLLRKREERRAATTQEPRS